MKPAIGMRARVVRSGLYGLVLSATAVHAQQPTGPLDAAALQNLVKTPLVDSRVNSIIVTSCFDSALSAGQIRQILATRPALRERLLPGLDAICRKPMPTAQAVRASAVTSTRRLSGLLQALQQLGIADPATHATQVEEWSRTATGQELYSAGTRRWLDSMATKDAPFAALVLLGVRTPDSARSYWQQAARLEPNRVLATSALFTSEQAATYELVRQAANSPLEAVTDEPIMTDSATGVLTGPTVTLRLKVDEPTTGWRVKWQVRDSADKLLLEQEAVEDNLTLRLAGGTEGPLARPGRYAIRPLVFVPGVPGSSVASTDVWLNVTDQRTSQPAAPVVASPRGRNGGLSFLTFAAGAGAIAGGMLGYRKCGPVYDPVADSFQSRTRSCSGWISLSASGLLTWLIAPNTINRPRAVDTRVQPAPIAYTRRVIRVSDDGPR